jgi:hypothetical protein
MRTRNLIACGRAYVRRVAGVAELEQALAQRVNREQMAAAGGAHGSSRQFFGKLTDVC